MSELYELYKKLGNEAYGDAINKIAPYFSTIPAEFLDLRQGFCEVLIRNQKSIHNHLAAVHVIAICNGAELVAGLTTDISIPTGRQWIPVGMTVEYLAKVKTDFRVIAEAEDIDWTVIGIIIVPVSAYNIENKKVFSAEISMKVGEL